MDTVPPLHPTLWRTCRVLANRTRLRLLRLILQEPDLSVSRAASALNLSMPQASLALRALEARGLLTVQRRGRQVTYRFNKAPSTQPAQALVPGLRRVLNGEPNPVEDLFKLATAFTHPRRIDIYRILRKQAQTFDRLGRVTGISAHALRRHLKKLEDRGLVSCHQGAYVADSGSDVFGQALSKQAAA